MEYRKLGSLNVSLVGLGCNNFGWRTDAAGTAAVLDAALDAGINFFDTADVYGGGQSEEFLGKALKGRRQKAIIATKFGMKMGEGREGARPEYVRAALEASLRRLQEPRDRKSTRLNSSHGYISYAVFCWKKKNTWCTSQSSTCESVSSYYDCLFCSWYPWLRL